MALHVAGPSALWSGFTAKAELLGAAVIRTAPEATAVGLLRETANEFTCTATAARRFPRLAEHATPAAVDQPAREVVAAGEFAVAETGSVAVNEARADRGVCFLAERLWLLVPEAEIVASLDTAMLRMRDVVQAGAAPPPFIRRPSPTAGNERRLT